MTEEDFYNSLSLTKPPVGLSDFLNALWYEKNGDWEKAHTIIQDVPGETAAWIHAYLHHREGDIGNADYWYRRARKTRPSLSLEEEWKNIVSSLL